MAISRELFLAILALDAYNRGYNAGIGNDSVGLGVTGQIGNAAITTNSDVLKDADGNRRDQAASFFAISYRWGSETIISYRGTDDPVGDARSGFVVGAGFPDGDQARLAVEFYKQVAGPATDPQTANITPTGHSLGGGLAGFMAGIYGKQAVIYDNMPFERAAQYCPAICANNNGALLDRAA